MKEDIEKIEYFLQLINEAIDENIEVKEIEIQELKQALENLIARNKELENDNINLNDKLQMTKNSIKIANLDVMEDYIPKSKVREKIEEQINEADDVLINKHYLDNFNGTQKEQEHYYNGYKDATLFIEELLQEGDK